MNLLALLQKPKQPVRDHALSDFFSTESALESHVCNVLFPVDKYTLLERSLIPTRVYDDRKPAASPAFKFLDKSTGKSFWLEVKTCSPDWSNHIHWCTDMELRRYVSCHKKTPTFLLLDIENSTSAPHTLYLLSMTQARYAHLLQSCITHFEVPVNQPLLSEDLWKR